jgi:hypothetical protein
MTVNYQNPVCIKDCNKREFHRAGWIMKDAFTLIENGYLEIENGFICGVHKGRPKEKSNDHVPGVMWGISQPWELQGPLWKILV